MSGPKLEVMMKVNERGYFNKEFHKIKIKLIDELLFKKTVNINS